MTRRSYTPERIINKLREVEIIVSQGSTIGEAARKIGVSQNNSTTQAGRLESKLQDELKESGERNDSRCHKGSQSGAGSGLMMAHALDLRSRMQGPCVELRAYGSKNGGWKSL